MWNYVEKPLKEQQKDKYTHNHTENFHFWFPNTERERTPFSFILLPFISLSVFCVLFIHYDDVFISGKTCQKKNEFIHTIQIHSLKKFPTRIRNVMSIHAFGTFQEIDSWALSPYRCVRKGVLPTHKYLQRISENDWFRPPLWYEIEMEINQLNCRKNKSQNVVNLVQVPISIFVNKSTKKN
jgi:hypothetical protein